MARPLRTVDAPRSDALVLAIVVGGVAALGTGAYWVIQSVLDARAADRRAADQRATEREARHAATAAANAQDVARTEPVPEPVPAPEPVPEPVVEPTPEPEPAAPDLPDELDRAMIQQRMRPALRRLARCDRDDELDGTIKVRLEVSPSGQVASASVSAAGGSAACIAGELKKLEFPATARGGSFTYSVSF